VLRSNRFGGRLTAGVVAGIAAVGTIAGCGSSQPSNVKLTVLGAASLSNVLPMIAAQEKYSFAGSGTLETDIQQGEYADVFAAASPKQTTELYKAGLATKPVEFATNTLVLIVPKDNPAHITSIYDLTKKGVKIVVCEASQPCGDYASTAFAALGITTAADKNIVSYQSDVSQVVTEIANGEGDAGLVYITDAKTAGNAVSVIRLPTAAMPVHEDTISVIKASKHEAAAKAFVQMLLAAKAQAVLQAAGFGKP
jgi:molybdate transport system substrate-binding protein